MSKSRLCLLRNSETLLANGGVSIWFVLTMAVRVTFMALGSTEEGLFTCAGLGVAKGRLLPDLGNAE